MFDEGVGFEAGLRRGLWTGEVAIQARVIPSALTVEFCAKVAGEQTWQGVLPKFEGYILGNSPPTEGCLRLVYFCGYLVYNEDGSVELHAPMFWASPPRELRAELFGRAGVVFRLVAEPRVRNLYWAAIVEAGDGDETARDVVNRGWQAVLRERVTAFAMGRRGGIVATLPLDVLGLIAARLRPAFFQ